MDPTTPRKGTCREKAGCGSIFANTAAFMLQKLQLRTGWIL